MRKHLLLSTLFVVFGFIAMEAQVSTYPIQENARLQNFDLANPYYKFQPQVKYKRGTRDTLRLPFFDDFSESTLYPDSTRWLNNDVYINNEFPVEPPTYNVATFDALASNGRPYDLTINKDRALSGDSLISQPINLRDSFGSIYTPRDSIMLSFFYQPNGYGYHLSGDDSLRLFFKAKSGIWVRVWAAGGQAESLPFQQVIIPIADTAYLHEGFQFAFTTVTARVGNANHWHVDYILLDSRRSQAEDYYNDYAVQTNPTSLLKNYTSMPYSHFQVNQASHMADAQFFRASNLFNVGKNIEVKHRDIQNGNILKETNYNENSNNILAQSSSLRNLPIYQISGVSGSEPIVINREISIRENGIINEYRRNDTLVTTQEFHDYYAYDDGSAERGFGFTHNANPSNLEAQIAVGFDIAKEDTLYAIATYFNEAIFDVSRRTFQYRVWSSLAGVDGATSTEVIYSSENLSPSYNIANGERTFSTHYLDTTLIIPAGKIYIGWWQPTIFNLNVGWDMNYGNLKPEPEVSPNLYAGILDEWSQNDLPIGALMMRPHFGTKRELYAGVHKIERKKITPLVYPNPTRNRVNFGEVYEQVSIRNLEGKEVAQAAKTDTIDLEGVKPGIYFVTLVDEDANFYSTKLIILAP